MRKKLLFSLLLFFISSGFLFSQTLTIKGKVTDETGNPLPNATILAKGVKAGSQTNDAGNFIIKAKPGADGKVNLVISYVNYKSQTISTDGKADLVIKLEKAATELDEVVIIGYQAVKRKDLMASASTVTVKDLKDNPLNNSAEALQGKLAGVNITMNEGGPGADATITIRGRNSITGTGEPLYVVDGIPLDNALSVISPQDIESIDVLKDGASTAIYGSRGANGVVVITTKGGKNTNGKTTVTYNAFWGVQKLAKKLDMMNPYDYVLYQYEKGQWLGDSSAAKKYIRTMSNYDTINTYYRNIDGLDWQDLTMGRNAMQQSHNISISGGNASSTFSLSLTANKQEGLLPYSDLDRKLVNFKFDNKASNKLKVGFNVRYTDQLVNGAGTSDASGAGSNRLRQYTRYRPLLLPGQTEDSYDPDLDLNNAGNGFNVLNPLLLAAAETRKRYTNVINMNGFLQYTIVKNLMLRSTLGFDVNNVRNKSFDDTLTNTAKSLQRMPFVIINGTQRKTFNLSNVLTYNNPSLLKTKHSLNILLGQEITKRVLNTDFLQLNFFPIGTTADQAFNNLQFAQVSSVAPFIQPKPSTTSTPDNMASFFTAIDYNFNQKYFAKFNLRADGSSIFGESHVWGYFPSATFAWKINKEKFFNSRIISDLRLRASYGSAGNNRITPYSYRTQYTSPANAGYGLNNALAGVFIPNNLGNEDLKWETQISRNVGVDMTMWKGKLNVVLELYSNLSKDLLLLQTIPASSGYTTQFQNIGETRNNGIELQLSGTVMRKKNFLWSANFNISANKNKINSLGPNQQILRNSGWFSSSNFPADYILKVGEEVGTMYGYVNDGFYTLDDFIKTPFSNSLYPNYTTQYTLDPKVVTAAGILANTLQPGSPKFKDINGDGKITPEGDRIVIGHAQPKFYGGLMQTFTYKNFDLSIFLNYSVGGNVFNSNKLEYASAYGSELNMLTINRDRWKMIDANGNPIQRAVSISGTSYVIGMDSATIAGINSGAKIWFPSTSINGFYSQSYAVEDASFLRINNITLGYNFSKKLLSKVKATNFRVYVTANNVAIITGYTGYDPDVNARRNDASTMGVDYSAYPRAKTFVAGLNLSL